MRHSLLGHAPPYTFSICRADVTLAKLRRHSAKSLVDRMSLRCHSLAIGQSTLDRQPCPGPVHSGSAIKKGVDADLIKSHSQASDQ